MSGKWYRVDDTAYLWSDVHQDYIPVGSGGGGGSSSWGGITGTITDQTDLVTLVSTAEASAKSYADGLVVGLWDDRGGFDASGGSYPSSGGSGTVGAIKKGDIWTVTVAGTLPTSQAVEVGDVVRALVDSPGNTQSNWAITQNNIGYTAESSANKDTDGTLAANSDTKYASQKAVKTYIDSGLSGKANTSHTHTASQISDANDVGKNILQLANPSAIRFMRVNADNTVTLLSGADMLTALSAYSKSEVDSIISGLSSSGESYAIMTADGTPNTSTNTWSDVQVSGGGAVLRIPVVAGKMYYFDIEGRYDASSTAVGSKFGIDGPSPTILSYESDYSLSATSMTFNQGLSAMQLPATTNGTSAATTGNRFSISGFYMPSADGYLKVILGCETNLGSITPKAGCFIRTKILY